MEKKSLIYLDEIHLPIVVKDVIKNVWLAIMAAIIVCIGVFVYSNSSHQSLYKNEATFVVSPRSNGAYVGFYSSMSTANEMAGVFQEVFSSDVLKRLIKEDLENPNLSFVISASVAKGTNILTVSAQADSPETAHNVMKSVLKNYRVVSGYLFGSVVLDVLKNPQISVTPINPFQTKKYMIVGSCMAVIMMVAVIALLSVFRPTVKTIACAKRQMEESPLGVLKEEKRRLRFFLKRFKKAPLITDTSTSFQYSESVLRLAHKIRYQMQKDGKKVLLVTSVAENEGKYTVSSNPGLSSARNPSTIWLILIPR